MLDQIRADCDVDEDVERLAETARVIAACLSPYSVVSQLIATVICHSFSSIPTLWLSSYTHSMVAS